MIAPRTSLVWGALFAVLALVVLDGGVAGWAQLNARTEAPELGDLYSLDQHVIAMVVLSGFTVGVASALSILRERVIAVLVVAGVAAGPMAIIASPVTSALMVPDFTGTRWWWRLLVQGSQFVILIAWTWWTVRCLSHAQRSAGTPPTAASGAAGAAVPAAALPGRALSPITPRAQPAPGHGRISPLAIFCLYPAVALTAQIVSRTDNGAQSPGLLAVLGWAGLGAACVILVIQSPWRSTRFAALAGGASALTAMYVAYYRPGGWPGVAGWDGGGESPIVLSLSTTVCVLAGPLIGAVLRLRHPPALPAEPASPARPAEPA